MIDLVIDSSVAIKWFVPEAYSAEADRILLDHDKGALSFLAPEVIYAEFGNIVWKKHIFQGLDAGSADFALAKFQQLNFSVHQTSSYWMTPTVWLSHTNALFTIAYTWR